MFSRFLSTTAPPDPTKPNIHPPTAISEPVYGRLLDEDGDLKWTATTSGFITETMTWYLISGNDDLISMQVVHASVGLWYPTIQFVFRLANPKTGRRLCYNLNLKNFTTQGASCKADEFSASFCSKSLSFNIKAKLDEEISIDFTCSQSGDVDLGCKVGAGKHGGYTFFGSDKTSPDGHVFHKFWPRTTVEGKIIKSAASSSSEAIVDSASSATEEQLSGMGCYINATQGMRPDLIAKSWNFAFFTSPTRGVSAILMQFITPPGYGVVPASLSDSDDQLRLGTIVTVGCITVDDKVSTVVGSHVYLGEENPIHADSPYSNGTFIRHINTTVDTDTGYEIPEQVEYNWCGPCSSGEKNRNVSAKLTLNLGAPDKQNGLVERIDVLAEVPYILKKVVNYVAQTKPYIYQYMNKATIQLSLPSSNGQTADEIEIEGNVLSENSFVS